MRITQLSEAIGLLQKARDEVQRYEFHLLSLFKRIRSPLLMLDRKGAIQQANASALEALGYRAEELKGLPFCDLCIPRSAKNCQRKLASALDHPDEPPSWKATLIHPDGSRHAYRLSAQVVELDGNGELGMVLHCLTADDESLPSKTLAEASRAATPPQGPLRVTPTLPTDRPVLGKDLETLPGHLRCSINRCCRLLGITPTVWWKWRNAANEPIPNRAVALHLRLLDAFPELAEAPYAPVDLHQALEQKLGRRVTLIELSLLLGMGRASAYRWGRGVPPTEIVFCLITRLMELMNREPTAAMEYYLSLVEAQADVEGIDDIWTQGWHGGEDRE